MRGLPAARQFLLVQTIRSGERAEAMERDGQNRKFVWNKRGGNPTNALKSTNRPRLITRRLPHPSGLRNPTERHASRRAFFYDRAPGWCGYLYDEAGERGLLGRCSRNGLAKKVCADKTGRRRNGSHSMRARFRLFGIDMVGGVSYNGSV